MWGIPDRTWQIGIVPLSVDVTVTFASALELTIEIYNSNSDTVGYAVFPGVVGTQTFNFSVVGMAGELEQISLRVNGSYAAGDSVDNIVVNVGPPNISEFWTDFVNSYEIP